MRLSNPETNNLKCIDLTFEHFYINNSKQTEYIECTFQKHYIYQYIWKQIDTVHVINYDISYIIDILDNE